MKKIQEIDVQSAATKSAYVFVAISVVFAFFSLLAGSLLIIDLVKNNTTMSIDAIYWVPLLIGFIGFTFGFIAKEKAKSNKVSPEQACAVDLTIYSNVIIPLMYIFCLLVLSFVSYMSLD